MLSYTGQLALSDAAQTRCVGSLHRRCQLRLDQGVQHRFRDGVLPQPRRRAMHRLHGARRDRQRRLVRHHLPFSHAVLTRST